MGFRSNGIRSPEAKPVLHLSSSCSAPSTWEWDELPLLLICTNLYNLDVNCSDNSPKIQKKIVFRLSPPPSIFHGWRNFAKMTSYDVSPLGIVRIEKSVSSRTSSVKHRMFLNIRCFTEKVLELTDLKITALKNSRLRVLRPGQIRVGKLT